MNIYRLKTSIYPVDDIFSIGRDFSEAERNFYNRLDFEDKRDTEIYEIQLIAESIDESDKVFRERRK